MGKWDGSRSAETRTQGGKMYQWCKVRQCRRARALPVLAVWKKKVSPHTSFWKLRRRFPHGTVACKRKKFFRNGVGYIGQGVKWEGIPPKFRGCCFGLHPRYCGTEVYHETAVIPSLYEYNMVYT